MSAWKVAHVLYYAADAMETFFLESDRENTT